MTDRKNYSYTVSRIFGTVKPQILLFLLFGCYFIITFLEVDFWGTVLSPVTACASSALLFRTYLSGGHTGRVWFFTFLAVLSWTVCDIIWAVFELALGIDPGNSAFLMYAYTLPNIFLGIAVRSYVVPYFKKVNGFQLFLDLSITLIAVIGVVWILFLNRRFRLIFTFDPTSVTTFVYMLTDLMLVSTLFLLFSSSRGLFSNATMMVFSAGLVLYSVTDLIYCFQFFNESYDPNTVIDGFFILGFVILAWAGTMTSKSPLPHELPAPAAGAGIPSNYGTSNRVLLLLFIPLGIVAVRGFSLPEVLFFLVIIAGHQVLSTIVQKSILHEFLLSKEQENREELERRIRERTEELVRVNRELDYLSRTDVVTGLNNRRFFLQEIESRMNRTEPGRSVVLFYMDLDRFKAVNDTFGHQVGDTVLTAVARRLLSWKTPDMLLARLGGDEFVLAFDWNSRESLEKKAQELVRFCGDPVSIPPHVIRMGLSIGIAVFPQDAQDSQTLFRNADIAMYEAKKQSGRRYAFFTHRINAEVQRKYLLGMLLQKADFDKEFQLHFQPQFRIPEERITGMESLLRWKSPEIGQVSPGEFIPIAEETGVIISIGEWVMKKAVARISDWNSRYGANLKIGINITPDHLCSDRFIAFLKEQLRVNLARPEWIDIEITENSAMTGDSGIKDYLKMLSNLGVSISIDDFGTGYSSISYIKRYKIDRLKIARELVDNIDTDESDAQIINSIIMVARSMNIRTIAEGVEKKSQSDSLVRLGCEEIQGYLMGKPVPAEDFENFWLAKISPALKTSGIPSI